MQSSTVVTFRALVMLGCLIAIPLVALFGNSSLPEWADSLWAQVVAAEQSSEERPLGDADFRPLASSQTQPATTVVAQTPSQGENSSPDSTREATQTPATADRYQSSRYDEAGSMVVPASYNTAAYDGQAYRGRTSHLLQTQHTENVQPVDTLVSRPPVRDRRAEVEERLRQLGVVYSQLEFWGGEQKLYRFSCRVAVGADSSYTVDFNETRPSPLQAMTGVLNQVESWHRRQAASRF